MVTTVRRIDPLSAAKISGILYAALGLLGGLMAAAFGGIMSTFAGDGAGLGFGVFSIITFPIMYGILGFIFGFLSALFYNLIADRVGGVEVELDGYDEPSIL